MPKVLPAFCPRCHGERDAKKASLGGGWLAQITDVEIHQIIALICRQCGYVELFDRDIWESMLNRVTQS